MDFSRKRDFNSQDLSGSDISEEQQAAARKVTAAHARDPEDFRLLLTVLGLLSAPDDEDGVPAACLYCGKDYVRIGSGRASYYCRQRCWRDSASGRRVA
ncbi:hypothetical protein [Streptomyces sp. NPDC056661]|uniref:hypothetical protein n=1 Tax=Streptomyces sp. NPDC056661 TaxID=3345898 RepID=UPI003675F922